MSPQKILLSLFACLVLELDVAEAAPPQFTLTYVGTGSPSAVDASGQVVLNDGASEVFLWNGGVTSHLGSLKSGSPFSDYGYGINASGQVAGFSETGSGNHAVRWTGTTPTDLGLGGGVESYGFAINDSGQVAGYINDSSFRSRAVLWTGTTSVALNGLGGPHSLARGINASGQAAGFATNSQGWRHAVRWTGVTPTDLGTLGGLESVGVAINSSGQVAGVSDLAAGGFHPVLWTGTSALDLGTLGGAYAEATALNDSGQVVGYSYLADNWTVHPFLYTGGVMYDLNSLIPADSGVTFTSISAYAVSINASGQLALASSGGPVLLTPMVPEPGMTALLACGSAVCLGARRRRRSD